MGFFTDEELPNADDATASKVDDLEKEDTTPSPEPPKEPANNDDDRIPAKYRGKSIEDIIRMHQSAEELMHRHSEEVGLARKMTQQALEVIQRQSENGSPTKRTDVDQEDDHVEFFADPAKKVDELVSRHPDVVAAREATMQQRKEAALRKVVEAAGDPQKYLQDPEFLEWVQQRPFRLQALRHADANHDADAAIEIFETYNLHKERKQSESNQQKQQVQEQTNDAKRKGMVDGGSPGVPSAKVYRRADLIRLQNTDPDRYERLQPEIMKAYLEGRVR